MNRPRRRLPHGFSLIVVLLLLGVVSLLGVAAARLTLVQEAMVRSDRDTEIALQAAEAALADAERDVLGPNTDAAARLCLFQPQDVAAFAAGCGSGRALGLCAAAAPGETPAWIAADLSPASAVAVPYGHFTGQTYAAGDDRGAVPAHLPRYIVEAVRHNGGWEPRRLQGADAGSLGHVFRVTAVGHGVDPRTQVMLQTTLYKPTVSPGCP
ncbi:pilus assembly protein [Variovorax sp. UMC13]|uniref:pilus assembly protein n=1 Tax=Variovorax sp. UMC13 TaxID=1862326 RepID=UPI0016047EC1|nr:pilus assembly protein [Variovorax sp. UMC13]